ncbi:MAG TPA: molybdate ABC transporter substrate-binding protein [Terrimesophilobacter sp.]|nr:molybdate ABC transporter substrate-binding protein [Terrimesophilobacter sp.]HRP99146.1 molybdate ABC transporter substrate-binding protein [Terrimesophilobacter sp.]
MNRRPGPSIRSLAVVAAAAMLLAGCAITRDEPGTPEPTQESTLTGSLTIAAAASLAGSFGDLAAEFEAEHSGVEVRPLILDGSSTLATQLREGAPFDVFASANESNMDKVADLVVDPTLFATNTLQLAVAPGNPLGITSLEDLVGLDVVLCAPEVPCGDASQQLLTAKGVSITPVSEEQNVTAVLTKVAAGEADAGLVYVTDVADAGGEVTGVDVGGAEVIINRYPIAAVAESPNADIAAAFVAFVLSERGRAVLATYGFGSP